MQEALDGVGLVHGADPGAEAGVGQAVAEAADGVGDDEDGVGWVGGEDGVGDDVAEGGHDGDAAAAEGDVDAGIGEGGGGVADEGGEEDERDDGVAEVVVFFELGGGQFVDVVGSLCRRGSGWTYVGDQSLYTRSAIVSIINTCE